MDVRPIPVYPHERLADTDLMEALRTAFLALEAPYAAQPVPAVPGSPGRVIGWGQVAPWACNQVVIRAENERNPASIALALQVALTAPDGDPRIFSMEAWMSAVMGGPVRYVGEESL